jgi:hypothetical protein
MDFYSASLGPTPKQGSSTTWKRIVEIAGAFAAVIGLGAVFGFTSVYWRLSYYLGVPVSYPAGLELFLREAGRELPLFVGVFAYALILLVAVVATSRLLIIRLLQQPPTGSVEGCRDRRSPRRSASFKPTSRRRRPASSTWRLVGGLMASSVRDAGTDGPTNW